MPAASSVTKLSPGAREHRRRLLEGMARVVAEKGYGETSIADIVRAAAVSRRTFYEHFETKADCFVALYEAASQEALQALVAAVDPAQPWQLQTERAITVYLEALARSPQLLRTLFVEILGLGWPGLAARRRVNTQIAAFICATIHAPEGEAGPSITPELALIVVGGIHELVLQAVEQAQTGELNLRALVVPATQLVAAAANAST